MRTTIVAALLVAAPPAALTATPASAYCDPKYRPLCTNDCQTRPPDPKDPLEVLTRLCPE